MLHCDKKNSAPVHATEGQKGEQRCGTIYSYPRSQQRASLHVGEETNLLSLLEIKPQIVQPLA